MSDLIRRQAAIDACLRGKIDGLPATNVACDCCAERIRVLPSAQTERKKGKWISADSIFGGIPYRCSECGEETKDTVMGKARWKFCPNCGADMKGEQDATD